MPPTGPEPSLLDRAADAFARLAVLEHLDHLLHAVGRAGDIDRGIRLDLGDHAHQEHGARFGHHLDVHRIEVLRAEEARLDVGRDHRITGARRERRRRADGELVGDAAYPRQRGDHLLHLGVRHRVGHLAADEHRAVVGGDVDVDLEAVFLVEGAARAALDALVLDLRAGGAAIGVHAVARRGAAADHHRGAAAEQPGECEQRGDRGRANHFFGPNSWWSIRSHRQCSTRRWTSWMRAVTLCGTQIETSPPLSAAAILPPPLPVRPTTCTPASCAACTASTTLPELPLVEMASSTSPLRPMARTCLAKTSL